MWPFLQTPNSACGCSSQSGTNQCGCDKISSLDVSYNGPALVCSGIELCDSLTVALQKIEEKICTTGNISGSGTNNYIPKWTPNGTTLGNSQMRDDGVTIGIGTFYSSPLSKFSIESGLPNHIINNTINATTSYVGLNAGVSDNTNVPKNNYTGTGIFGYANSSTTQNIGVSGSGSGIDAILNIGVYGKGIASLNGLCVTSLGGKFEAGFGTNNYSVQLIDGTQQTGRFLKSVTNNGHANWANITTADITGFPTSIVSGSGTNNYVARWTPSGTQLGIGLIQDNNTSIGINSAPLIGSKFNVSSDLGVGISSTQTVQGIGVDIRSQIAGASANFGAIFFANNSTSQNVSIEANAISGTTSTNIGIRAIANGGLLNYSAQLKDGTEGVGKVLTCITADGKANWSTLPSPGISGSGINNYVTRWSPDGTTLSTGVIQDNNTSVGINSAPDSIFRLTLAGNSLNGLYSYTTRVATNSDTAFGINSTSYGTSSLGENIGVYGTAANNTNVNYGVYGGCTAPTTGKNIGLRGLAGGGAAGTYAIQLQDGTQAAGKFLKSITNNGEANWANITSSDTTGATGSFTSQDGKTITVTNGLITSII